MRRIRSQPKRLRITLESQPTTSGDREVIGVPVIIELPTDFANLNAALPYLLRIEQQVKRPENLPKRQADIPERLPPWYPWNFTLDPDGDWVTQTDHVALPASGVMSFVDYSA